jgi:hypothetical protein
MTDAMPFWIQVKQATARASDAAGGDKVLAAVTTRITHSARFSDYANLSQVNRVTPFDAAIEVDRHNLAKGKSAEHLELGARELGFVLVRLPAGRGPARVLEVGGKSAQEMGALMMELGQALADGKLSGPERAAIHERIRELQIDLADLDAAVMAEGEAP